MQNDDGIYQTADYVRLSINRYASPGGAQIITMDETNHWQARPEKGALKGILLAKIAE